MGIERRRRLGLFTYLNQANWIIKISVIVFGQKEMHIAPILEIGGSRMGETCLRWAIFVGNNFFIMG